MQVHRFIDAATHPDTLQGWKREGRVRHVGVTRCTASAPVAPARLITARPVDFIQINYSVGEREAERCLLPLALGRRVAVIANDPFVGGDLIRRLRTPPLPEWAPTLTAITGLNCS